MKIAIEEAVTQPKVSDLVQITDRDHHWFPSIAVVDEVKSWGVQAYVWIVTNDEEPNMRAFIRLEAGSFMVVGHAVLTVE